MMKRVRESIKGKIRIAFLFAAVCAACCALSGCNSGVFEEARMLKWANERLDHYYAGMERTLEGSRIEDDIYIFTFVTDDERQIEFEAKCWYGAYSTPWGSISFIKEKKFSENFIEKLTEYLCEGITADFTGYEIDEMIQWFKDTSQSISGVYAEYGDEYTVPEFTVVVTYEGRSAEIAYSSQSDHYLEEALKEKLIG